ncbi:MAG TPA: TIGR02452 family protein [Polyangiaceae bacterium]
MDNKAQANETLRIIADGRYATKGRNVDIGDAIRGAVAGTVTYKPGEVVARRAGGANSTRVEVTNETTSSAGRRLAIDEKESRVCVLNFASARKPGGGFLGGAKAQEEDLARSSALYACLEPQRAYYDANRAHASTLYTDHVIYSPDVPFFRDDRGSLVAPPAMLSVISAPAPNAGAIDPSERPQLLPALARRAGIVLEIAAKHGHRVLVLGAWGCGVFRNDPRDVATTFRTHLERSEFDRVVFAVWDRGGATIATFREVLTR